LGTGTNPLFARDMAPLKLKDVNRMLTAVMSFHYQIELFEAQFGKIDNKSLQNTFLRTLVAKTSPSSP